MAVLKRLEIAFKLCLAALAAALLWRPRRRSRALALLRAPRKILLVRTDDRVGEALLTTPLLRALRALPSPPQVHLLVHPRAQRVLEGHPDVDRLIPFPPRQRLYGPLSPVLRALRNEGYDAVVNCANWEAPSVGPALISRLAGAKAAVIGPSHLPVGWLMDVKVAPRKGTRSEARQRLHLLSPLGVDAQVAQLCFREVEEDEVVRATLLQLGPGPFAVVNPGGRLGHRRVPPGVFAAAAAALAGRGITPLVTWGPGEQALAQQVLREAPAAVCAPPTSVDQLAALMRRAKLTVSNNTGPMHLSVAVGTPTVGLFLHMDLSRWGHCDPPHRMVDLTSQQDPEAVAAAAVREVVGQLDLAPESP